MNTKYNCGVPTGAVSTAARKTTVQMSASE
jgi:hypothetical protein